MGRPFLANLRYPDERLPEEELLRTGTVYLICLRKPFHRMRHYLGWSRQVTQRLWHHRRGTGANVLKFVNEAGIKYRIVRRWEGQTRLFERFLKNKKDSASLCPFCRDRRRRQKRRAERARRALALKTRRPPGVPAAVALHKGVTTVRKGVGLGPRAG